MKCLLACALAFSVASISLVQAQSITVKKSDGALPPAQLGIAPPRVEQDLVLGDVARLDQSITLYNYGKKAKVMRIELVDVNASAQAITSTEQTLAPWAILNPTEFTIPAGGEQTIRLSIRPSPDFPKGTHHAMLKISQHIADSIKLDEDKQGLTMSLGSSYGLPIIVHVK